MNIYGVEVSAVVYKKNHMYTKEECTPEALERFINAPNFCGGEMIPHNAEHPSFVVNETGELRKYYGALWLLRPTEKVIELKSKHNTNMKSFVILNNTELDNTEFSKEISKFLEFDSLMRNDIGEHNSIEDCTLRGGIVVLRNLNEIEGLGPQRIEFIQRLKVLIDAGNQCTIIVFNPKEMSHFVENFGYEASAIIDRCFSTSVVSARKIAECALTINKINN